MPRRQLVFVFAIALIACQRDAARGVIQAGHATVDAVSWDRFIGGYLDAYFALRPDVAVNAGRHEFDGMLPDWSPAGLAAQVAMLDDWKKRATTFDTTGLDASRRLEREYLIARIDGERWWLVRGDGPRRNPAYYANMIDPDVYLNRPYAPLPDRMRAYTAYARSLVTAASQIRANLTPPLPRTFIDRGRGMFGGFADFFTNDVPTVFAGVSDAPLRAEFTRANDSAVAAMKGLDAWLDSLRPTQTEAFAIGADAFRSMLYDIERVDTPLDTLEHLGREDLARNRAALGAACARFAPGATVAACVRRVSAHKPPGGTVSTAKGQLMGLRQFLIEKSIVTISGDEQARVAESPPYQRYNSAYIQIPGPYEKNMPSTYYVAPPDPAWSPTEQDEYIPGVADLLFTSIHEVWPGHFLQFLHANRSPSKFGQVFVGYAYAEGWAHYAEEMMWEAGYGDGDPETHIGQLLNALLRNVRFLSAIGLHTKGMTVAESERMFREQAFQDAAGARQQAARGTFDPEYLDYTMGKLMIRRLRDDWTASRGGRAAWQQFHDAFLSYGGPPIPFVRRAMLKDDAGPLF
jgi:Bacterial protein of unknown function (DUF885)